MYGKLHAASSGVVPRCQTANIREKLVALFESIEDIDAAAKSDEFSNISIAQLLETQRDLAGKFDRDSLRYLAILAFVERDAMAELFGAAA